MTLHKKGEEQVEREETKELEKEEEEGWEREEAADKKGDREERGNWNKRVMKSWKVMTKGYKNQVILMSSLLYAAHIKHHQLLSTHFKVSPYQNHHTVHFSAGFIPDPTSQLKASENSLILDIGILTLYWGGEWGPLRIILRSCSLVMDVHHICPVLMKKSCSGVYSVSPGSLGSSPLRSLQYVYAKNASLSPPLSAMFSPWKVRKYGSVQIN